MVQLLRAHSALALSEDPNSITSTKARRLTTAVTPAPWNLLPLASKGNHIYVDTLLRTPTTHVHIHLIQNKLNKKSY